MDKIYKRQDNIDEKIHSVKLPYIAWKVLFLVNGELLEEEMASLLEEDVALIRETLEKLETEGLIFTVEAAGAEEKVKEKKRTAKPEPQEEVKEPSIEEEAPEEKTEIMEEEALPEIEEKEPEPEKVEEEKMQEPEILMELEETEEKAPEPEPVPEKEEVSAEVESFESLSEIKEKPGKKEETIDESGLDLDLDFSDDLAMESGEKVEDTQVEKKAPAKAEEKQKEKPVIKSGQKTILVVDDSIVIRKMVEIALEDEKYNIQTAVSGKEGLDKIDQINPDLVILDLMLPDISGIDILKTVKASKGIPVIMLSGKDSPQMVENAKSEGADAFLPKPFKDDELVEKIKSLISN
ncbi:MAG: response regulator [Calditrichaceae bacterium]|nr:response regulator [Calditrichaceae bacterium]MBN2709070.1 response regulator [Calditrichaceae bacterium]